MILVHQSRAYDMSCHSDDFSLSSFSGPGSDVSAYDTDPSYYPLQSVFVRALGKWKQQSVSFVSLPPEVRNRVYQLACERSHTNGDLPVRVDAFHRCMFPCCERGSLMYSCKQVTASSFRFSSLPSSSFCT